MPWWLPFEGATEGTLSLLLDTVVTPPELLSLLTETEVLGVISGEERSGCGCRKLGEDIGEAAFRLPPTWFPDWCASLSCADSRITKTSLREFPMLDRKAELGERGGDAGRTAARFDVPVCC